METETPDPQTVSQLITWHMKRGSRTKKWTAEHARIPETTFRRKLGGDTDFTVGELARIAAALGVKPGALLPSEFREVAA